MRRVLESDAEFVDALLRGDEEAFNYFIEAFFPRLYRFVIIRVGGDHAIAQRLLRDGLGRAMRQLPSYRAEEPLFAWLCVQCQHVIVKHFVPMGACDTCVRPSATPHSSQIPAPAPTIKPSPDPMAAPGEK